MSASAGGPERGLPPKPYDRPAQQNQFEALADEIDAPMLTVCGLGDLDVLDNERSPRVRRRVGPAQIGINIRGVITGTKLVELMGGPAAPVMTMPP